MNSIKQSARLQQYANRELPDAQAGFRKGRGTKDQIANICWIIEKAREFQKIIYFCSLTMIKPLTVGITQTAEISSRDGNTRLPYSSPEKKLYAGQEATVRLDMEKQIDSKLGKEYIKAVYCHHAYLTSMQSTS